MTEEQIKKIVIKTIRKEVPKLIEELFSKSKEQLRRFFIKNIP